jgi:cell division protein FtsI/penicillin-binding protein 2
MNAANYHTRLKSSRPKGAVSKTLVRDRILAGGVVLIMLAIAVRLFQLQIIQGHFYSLLASGQHELFDKLLPERGQILVREQDSDSLYPVATNINLWTVYSDNRKLIDAATETNALAPLLSVPVDPTNKTSDEIAAAAKQNLADKEAEILKRLMVTNAPYELLGHDINQQLMDSIKALNFPNINFAPEKARFYPESSFSGQLLGFVGYQGDKKKGLYGIEGYWDKELSGTQGFLTAARDPSGDIIASTESGISEKVDGSNIILTVDRTLEATVCSKLDAAVKAHNATGGSVVMMDPATGAILAMCGTPDFDPNNYNQITDPSVFNNPAIWDAYEPGSVMKAITMAAGIDSGALTPTTTYTDTGSVVYGKVKIQNADFMAHGVQTMIDVLNKSLNTGAIFAMRTTGMAKFKSYLKAFGFGVRTGIELDTESPGNLSSLDNNNEINAASASFGQGITVTPLQLAVAYGAIANGGKMMKPYIVDSIVNPDGTTIKTQPRTVRQVISDQAAGLLTGMLVSVVKNGEGHRAGVPGYLVAGKTGTAQIAKSDGSGYESDIHAEIGTFAGFAPVSDPRFVMVVRINRPQDVEFAENSTAPLWGDIASFALKYLEVPPDDIGH